MEIKGKLRYLRISPRKVRLLADLIRGKKVKEAQSILNFTVKKATKPLLKLLNSAIASASHNFQIEPDNLYISEILVNEGPKLKRWRARARGQAFEIHKKTSHITIVLEEIEKKVKKRKKKKKVIKRKPREGKEKIKKPQFKPKLEIKKPRTREGRLRKIFRRKAF